MMMFVIFVWHQYNYYCVEYAESKTLLILVPWATPHNLIGVFLLYQQYLAPTLLEVIGPTSLWE